MFYSHEILKNRQYGVATIWLVATVGKGSSTKRFTRKTIEEVNVQKACGKIIEPGAPVALRLQGQLLFGVSRVYNKQCYYMLADLQKIQLHMHDFFTKFVGNQLDPEAGQTRPENLLIMNDPDFVPDMNLPQFDLDALLAINGQRTEKTSSQMSPHDSMLFSGNSNRGSGFELALNIRDSVSSGPRGDSPFGLQGLSSAQKPEPAQQLVLPQDDDLANVGHWGMEIDENGNILEMDDVIIVHQDELELPPLPTVEGDNQQANPKHQNQPIVDDQGDIVMMEEPLPEVQAPQEHQLRGAHDPFIDDNQHQAPARRKRRARVMQADEETQISRTTIRGWQDDYAQNCGAKNMRATLPSQARINAKLVTFGFGLANIGQNLGVPEMVHPLALDFSGDALFTALTGLEVPGRGTRRSATELIEDGEDENGRRVRPRLDDEADQQGRGLEGDAGVFDEGVQPGRSSPEVGREAQAPMSDHLSSALHMPWNRGSSAMPGSSIRGSAQKGRVASSPLGNRGEIQDPMLYSDGPSLGNDGFGLDFGGIQPQDNSFAGFNVAEGGAQQAQAEASEGPQLDLEGSNFLSFMKDTARAYGERRLDEDLECDRRWVALQDVFEPHKTPRATITHAFYHTLCLATKGRLQVLQDNRINKPFADIFVGIKSVGDVAAADEGGVDAAAAAAAEGGGGGAVEELNA
ncbi:Rec8 like protein-domain-containing protein [Hypoxylon sp. NC1633]|nr:Rec8 like protein-domain-containing protein [Hypoxylon sp. NC1633]